MTETETFELDNISQLYGFAKSMHKNNGFESVTQEREIKLTIDFPEPEEQINE